ncbi:MAG: penicillin-binding transpeptidase domain-containing protein, partial [Firmicutes bacterium]|nr:penicillin-binding transpeptidase domain-containing protein [Bacillota bacterium]
LLKNCQLTAAAQSQNLKQMLQNGEPFILARNLTARQIEQLAPILQQTEGLYTTTLRPRYGANSLAAHLLGYVGASTAQEAAALKKSGYTDTAYSGKSGLEKQYDLLLREQNSAHIAVAVDEKNQPTAESLRFIAANSSTAHNLQLTLNYNYQSIAESAMQDKNGAVVLMDVHNGDVLAMVSAPGFNQYIGQPATEGDIYVNKAISYYPPASIFKIVLTLAALDNQ